ncbi:hypothetical protein DCC35_15805 [Mangrovivirga cuniculi]|uniref:Uncharacterized protein n=1 Tax=Mangrovivirga cuniculi TaxID=2715131 RepID=A0A4D7JRF3_9BACT|nr:hypothetical protein DCC35_15805 [Mangrovivirga cuniculi]
MTLAPASRWCLFHSTVEAVPDVSVSASGTEDNLGSLIRLQKLLESGIFRILRLQRLPLTRIKKHTAKVANNTASCIIITTEIAENAEKNSKLFRYQYQMGKFFLINTVYPNMEDRKPSFTSLGPKEKLTQQVRKTRSKRNTKITIQ